MIHAKRKGSLLLIFLVVSCFDEKAGLKSIDGNSEAEVSLKKMDEKKGHGETDDLQKGAGTGSTVKLIDYWNGHANWEFYQKLTPTVMPKDHPTGGVHIEVVNGVWYLFARSTMPNPGHNCPPGLLMGTQVRVSHDKGMTWTEKVDVIVPKMGTPFECGATDGDVYYEAEKNEWIYLFQCIASDSKWHGCVAKKKGPSPVGLFDADAYPNPVIRGGDLWRKICDTNDDVCSKLSGGPGKVADEGTYQFIEKKHGYYYVSMHGFDGTNGYSGIVRSADLITWDAGNLSLDTPSDAIYSKANANKWRENWINGTSIGSGRSSISVEDGYYYNMVEAADISLLCRVNQNWNVGLVRSDHVTNTNWEEFPRGNPIYYSSQFKNSNDNRDSMACNVQYAGMFYDDVDKTWYMYATRMTYDHFGYGIIFYKLVRNVNLLENSNFWKCSVENWGKTSESTNHVVYRFPNESHDLTCFMQFNCGSDTCSELASVYQDVVVTDRSTESFEFGGYFKSKSVVDGRVTIALHQLNNSKILKSDVLDITVTQNYKKYAKVFQRHPDASKIRYEIYPKSPGNFEADSLFLSLSNGVSSLPKVSEVVVPKPSPEVTAPGDKPDIAQPAVTESLPPLDQPAVTESQPPVVHPATTEMNAAPVASLKTYYQADLQHQIGRQSESTAWHVNTEQDQKAYMSFGPYAKDLGSGMITVQWFLEVDNTTADDFKIVTVDIYDADSQAILASRIITRTEFAAPATEKIVSLQADLKDSSGHAIEARVYWHGFSYTKLSKVTIE